MSLWAFEEGCWALGRELVCGVDEAGAGPLAGRVYAGAVILPGYLKLEGLNDSKQVSPKKREILFGQICAQAVAWAVAWVEPDEIDEIDILNSRIKAMDLAVRRLAPFPDHVLVDGNRDQGSRYALTFSHETIIQGDSRSASIAAASILAKVSRDRHMLDMAKLYPEYQFEKHKGYGTKLHYEMLDQYGPSPIHRRSFLKKWERKQ